MRILILVICLNISLNTLGQKTNECDKIVISDILFHQESSKYDFAISSGNSTRNVRTENIENINDVIKIDGDYIKFTISYACGCGSNEKKLVTNGILQHDNSNNSFYLIKLYFKNGNNMCKKLCFAPLCFNLNELKKMGAAYIKFEGFDELVRLK